MGLGRRAGSETVLDFFTMAAAAAVVAHTCHAPLVIPTPAISHLSLTVDDAVNLLGLPRQLERLEEAAQPRVKGEPRKVKGGRERLQDL